MSIDFDGSKTDVGYAYFAKQSRGTDLDDLQDTLSFDNINQSTTNYIGTTLLQKNYGLYVSILNNPVHLSVYLNLETFRYSAVGFYETNLVSRFILLY